MKGEEEETYPRAADEAAPLWARSNPTSRGYSRLHCRRSHNWYTAGMNETFENSDIEKLASMVAREFASIRAEMDQGFTSLRTEMDERFNGIEQQLESMRAEIRSIREQLERLEEKSIPLAEQDELWQRVRRIEDKLGLPHELVAA